MSKIHTLTPDDEKAGETGSSLRALVQDISIAAVKAGSTNGVHAILISAYGANGLLHQIAKTIRHPDKDNSEPLSSTEVLVAALIAYHVAPLEVGDGKVCAEFNPLVINSALVDFEKLTGRRPDDDLIPQMCQIARESVADPQLLAEVARLRAQHPDGLVSGRPSNIRHLH